MQALEGQNQIGSVELGWGFFEAADLGYIEEEFSSWAVVQHEKQLLGGVEGVVETHDEGMVYFL